MTPIDVAPFGMRLLVGLAAALLTWGGAAVAGWRLASLMMPWRPAEQRFGIGLALGYALTGSVVGLLALMHVANAAVVAIVPVLLALLDVRSAFAAALRVPQFIRRAIEYVRASDWSSRIAIAASGAAVLTACVAGALPAVWWDPIAYHLPVAAAALAHRTLAFDPAMTQSGFPLLGEAAALPAFAVAGSAGAALVTLGAGCALAIVCAVLAERLAIGSGALAAALVTTCPLWMWLAPSFYVDVPFALFAVGSVGIGLVGVVDRCASEDGGVLAAGALAGAAAAVKYPGLEIAIVSVALVAFAARRRNAIRSIWFFAAAAIIMAGGWYVRTALLTHDPLYPFLAARISDDPAIRSFADRYVEMTVNWCGGSGSLFDALALPWRMLTGDSAATYCGDVGYALRLGIVFFVAAPALARRTWPTIITAFTLTLAWFSGSRQDRFIIPALCLYAVVVAAGVMGAPERLRRTGSLVLVAVGLVAIVAQWTPSLIGIASNSVVPAYAYVSGAQSGDDYLAERLEFYRVDEWLRAHVPPNARVIALDDVRDYYYSRAIWGNPFYQPVIDIDWTAAPNVRYRQLADGESYIVVNANRFYIARTPTGVDWRALDGDVRAGLLKPMYSAGDVTVYKLAIGY